VDELEEQMQEMFVEVPRTSTSKAIGDQIKQLIKSRQLTSGDALPPERELAAQLGVSRTTLREALRALTEEGMVNARQGSGWVVEPNRATAAGNLAVYFRLEDVTFAQVVEARVTNEPTITRLAAERRTDEELEAIEAAFAAMDASVSADEFLRADTAFHELIAVASHNPLLSFQMHPTMSLLEDVRLDFVAEPATIRSSQREHRKIVAAITAGDGDAAEQAMRAHISSFATRARPSAKAAGR
jgi:DNA-binding FadR family transcriptional regulator